MTNTPFKTLAEQVKSKPCGFSGRVEMDGVLIDTVCIEGRLSMNGQFHVPHALCGGTGEVLNVDDPLFEAMWEQCPCTLGSPGGHYLPYEAPPIVCRPCYLYNEHSGSRCRCKGLSYVRRSRADALSLLPKAILEAGYTFVIHGPGSLETDRGNSWLGDRYFADIHPLSDPNLGFGDVGDTVEDALCAALSKTKAVKQRGWL